VKLVSCPNCHAQYDVSGSAAETIACRCGASFPAQPPAPRDSAVRRCSSCGALLRGEPIGFAFVIGAAIVAAGVYVGALAPSGGGREAEAR